MNVGWFLFFMLGLSTQVMGWVDVLSGDLYRAFASFCLSLLFGLLSIYFKRARNAARPK